MSDIPIEFSSNADTTAQAVDRAAKATKDAEAQSERLAKTVAMLTARLDGLTGAANKSAAATKNLGNSAKFTGTDGTGGRVKQLQEEAKQLVNRRQLLTSIAKSAANDGEMIGNGAKKAATHWQSLFRGMGKGLQGIGRGVGIGGGIGAGILAFVALNKAIEIGAFLIDRQKQKVTDLAHAYLFAANAAKTAAESSQSRGLGAADAQGGNIVKLVSAGGGGLDLANKLTGQGFSATEAQSAVLAAQRKFGNAGPGAVESAVMTAARAANAGGGSLTEGVAGLNASELSNQPLAAARLLAESRGQDKFSVGDLEASESRIAGNKTTKALSNIAMAKGKIDLTDQGNIANGQVAINNQLAEAINPLNKIMLDQYNQESQQLEVLRQIYDSQGKMVSFFDRVLNPSTSAAANFNNAASRPLGASH